MVRGKDPRHLSRDNYDINLVEAVSGKGGINRGNDHNLTIWLCSSRPPEGKPVSENIRHKVTIYVTFRVGRLTLGQPMRGAEGPGARDIERGCPSNGRHWSVGVRGAGGGTFAPDSEDKECSGPVVGGMAPGARPSEIPSQPVVAGRAGDMFRMLAEKR